MYKKLQYFILLFNKYRYPLLALLVLCSFSFLSINSTIGPADFWEHSAVIKELQKNLINPQHPILVGDINEHAFFSPYHIFLAVLANIFNINSINVLLAFGIFNLLSFLILLPFAIKSIYNSHLFLAITFYALLLILLLWGSAETYTWSGYINLKSLKSNLSYPSLFVLNLFLVSMIIFRKSFSKVQYAILFFLIYLFVIISHPTSFLPILVFHGFFLFSITGIKYDKKYIVFMLMIALSLIIVYFYPYFPFYRIFNDPEAKLFEYHSYALYENLITNLWPVLICLPLLFVNGFSKTLKDPFLHSIILLSFAYIAGYAISSYGIGRVMGYIFLFTHILLAKNIALLESRKKSVSVSIITIVVLLSLNIGSLLTRFFPQLYSNQQQAKNNLIKEGTLVNEEIPRARLSSSKDEYSKFGPLKELVNDYDVVLSDLRSSWYIPSFSGKVVASKHPVYFQKDANMRREDINQFFKQNISYDKRKEILKTYKVKYILVNHSIFSKSSEVYKEIITLGEIIFQNDEITLIENVEDQE